MAVPLKDWLDGYEHIPLTRGSGPNLWVAGTNWKMLLHLTDTPMGGIDAITRGFKAKTAAGQLTVPHFMIDLPGRRKQQFMPLSWPAPTLKGGRGGWETNRARPIQTEIVDVARNAEGWSQEMIDFIGEHIADVMRQGGLPFNLDNVTTSDRHGTYAVENSPYRFTPQQFYDFDGVCDHANAPFNDHYDIARGNKQAMAASAKRQLGQPAPTPEPPNSEDDDMDARIARHEGTSGVFIVWFSQGRPHSRYALTAADIAFYETPPGNIFPAVPSIGNQGALLDHIPDLTPEPLELSDADKAELAAKFAAIPVAVADELGSRLV